MDQLTDSTIVVAVEGTLSTTLDGESLILHVDSGQYFGFNDVGTEIWQSLEEPQSIAELTEQIVSEYNVSKDRCHDDIIEIVFELIEKDLVKVAET